MGTTDPDPTAEQALSEFWLKLVTGNHRPFNLMSRAFRRLPGSSRCKVDWTRLESRDCSLP